MAKPAVSFAAKYRIIDFPLSNCANSGINTIGVLTQYEPTILDSYIGNGEKWGFNGVHALLTSCAPRQTDEGANWYKGTADAITQNIDFLDGLLSAEKDSADAFYVLHLLYPNLDYYVNVQSIHQDHLHPKVIFEEEDTMLEYGIPEDDIDFACENWNTVANLQLLEGGSNSSKNDTPLAEWVKKNHINKSKLLVEEDTSLDIKDFRAFIETRRSTMKNLLKQIIDCDLVAEE